MDYACVEIVGLPSRTKKSIRKWKREFYKKAEEVIPQKMFGKNLIIRVRIFCNEKIDILFMMEVIRDCLSRIVRGMKKEEIEIKMVEIQRIYQNKMKQQSIFQISDTFADEQEEDAPDRVVFEFLPALKL